MEYVTIEDCRKRLFQIAIDFDVSEKTPHYESNRKGMLELEGILERVRGPWYEGILTKAAYLFAAINKGHLFMNGNKRLAFIVMIDFLYRNGFSKQKSLVRSTYAKWFKQEFPQYSLVRKKFRTMYAWAFYNLNKALASDTENNFDDLKMKVESFLQLCMRNSK